MCGIGGVWGVGPIDDPARMAALFGDALAHRGPDGEGFLAIPLDPGLAPCVCRREATPTLPPLRGLVIHRRLSIIDLTTGDQPMGLPTGDVWIAYNGEIYNFKELRRELLAVEEADFRTTSDTEVILRVYRHWGAAGFSRLNGIFAFAMYDARQQRLILARDPVGVKPLYWAASAAGMAFASEVRPLDAAGYVPRDVAPERLAQFLFYRFVPAPGTLWRRVCKVTPGHALTFDAAGAVVADCDFASPPLPPQALGRSAVGRLLGDRLAEAVQRQLVADVPVGAFLSGGMDSTLVVAAARAHAAPQTFAIGFPSTATEPSELEAATRASLALGTAHAHLEISPDDYFRRFPEAVLQVEEPLAEAGMLLLSDLAGLAARHVKTVLTGQGADELLGGYRRHHAIRLSLLLPDLGAAALVRRLGEHHELLGRFAQLLGAPRGAQLAAAAFGITAPADVGRAVRGCGADVGQQVIVDGVRAWWTKGAGLDDMGRILYVDVRTSLAEDLLLMGDKTAMAHGLEARVPYLDLEYLRLAESLPGTQRLSLWHRRKWIQHLLARRFLPSRLARTLGGGVLGPLATKRGFEVPMDSWLRGGFGRGLLEVLTGNQSCLPAYVDPGFLRHVTERYLESRRGHYRAVLALYVLEIWLRARIAGVPVARLPTFHPRRA